MANLLLGFPNQVLSGVLAASAAETTLPITNLATDQGQASAAWQCPSVAGWFSVTLAAAGPLRAFGLFRTNLTAAATLQVRVWATGDSNSAPMFDTGVQPAGVLPGYGQAVVIAPGVLTGRLVRFDISDPANPDGHLNIPLAFAGPCWQPERNFGYASSNTRDAGGTVTVTRSGAELVRNDWQRRGFDLSMSAITPREELIRDQLEIYARRGANVLFVQNPLSSLLASQTVFGRLTPTAAYGYANNSALTRTWRATITERL